MSMTPEPLRIVLLGGTGFVGRAVLRRIGSEHGRNIEVRALVRNESAELPQGVTKVVGSLEALPKHLFFTEPHVLIHLATEQFDRDGRGYGNNARNARLLLQALPSSARAIVYGSSASVYGQGGLFGADERTNLSPETALARSRCDTEQILLEGARQLGRSAYVLRPRFVIGQGDAHTLPGLSRFFAKGLTLGSGEQRLTVIHVNDYAEAILRLAARAATSLPSQRALNVGYREPAQFRDFAAALEAKSRLTIPVSRRGYALLRRFSGPKLAALITRFELFGLSHHLDVSSLAELVGHDLTDQNPRAAIERARAELV
jgi:nucleoside-diphosphate-sugar epimerase